MALKITTMASFINNVWVPAGSPVEVPDELLEEGNTDNLADFTGSQERIVAQIAALGPTGPNPTVPQQIAPGTYQTLEGYVDGNTRYIAEGSAEEPSGPDEEGPIVEEPVERASANADDFDAAAIVDGTIDEVSPRLVGLTDEQKTAVIAAESARPGGPRAGIISQLD